MAFKVFLVFLVLSLSTLLSFADCVGLGTICIGNCCDPYSCEYDEKFRQSYCTCSKEGEKCGNGGLFYAGCCPGFTCDTSGDRTCKKITGSKTYDCPGSVKVGNRNYDFNSKVLKGSDVTICLYILGQGYLTGGCAYNNYSGKLVPPGEGYMNYPDCPQSAVLK